MEIDFNKRQMEEGLKILNGFSRMDDRDFQADVSESLPDLNPVTGAIANARSLISRGGIPVALGWNAIKAVGVGSGAYELCPGGMDVKAIAAGVAVGTMLIGSPTFMVPAGLLAKKHGPKAWKAIRNSELFNSSSPKP